MLRFQQKQLARDDCRRPNARQWSNLVRVAMKLRARPLSPAMLSAVTFSQIINKKTAIISLSLSTKQQCSTTFTLSQHFTSQFSYNIRNTDVQNRNKTTSTTSYTHAKNENRHKQKKPTTNHKHENTTKKPFFEIIDSKNIVLHLRHLSSPLGKWYYQSRGRRYRRFSVFSRQ